MLADNLDVPVREHGRDLPPAQQKWGAAQITGGSHNTRVLYDPVRIVCAKMRGQLMAAASARLGIPVSKLRTEDGYVIAMDGRKLSYGELTARASQLLKAPAAMPKNASEYKIIGKPKHKYGLEKIVQGKYPYPMDLHSSKEYLPTVVAMGATHGASVVSIDDSAAKAIKGVIAVTHVPGMPDYLIPEAVAVTAETFGIAKKAKEALNIQWSAGPMDQLSDAQIDDLLTGSSTRSRRRARASRPPSVGRTCRTPRWRPTAPSPTSPPTRPRSGAAPRSRPRPAPAGRDARPADRAGHVQRHPGRRGLRASPVPRPGRPGRSDLPAARQAGQAAVAA